MSHLSKNIRHLMQAHGIATATELSRLCGVAQPTIHRWLNDESRDPRNTSLSKMKSFFNISLDRLLNDDLTELENTELPEIDLRALLEPKSSTNLSKKTHTERSGASQRHSRFTMSGLDAYATDFYISNEGYFVIEQECDAMSVLLTSAQLEHLLKMMDYEELIEKVRAQEIEAAKPKSPDGADKS